MSIQSIINQNLSLAGYIFSQSEYAQEQRATTMARKTVESHAKRELAILGEQMNDANDVMRAAMKGEKKDVNEELGKMYDEAQLETAEAAGYLAKQNPTPENIRLAAYYRKVTNPKFKEAIKKAETSMIDEQTRIDESQKTFGPPEGLYKEPDPTESIRRAGTWYKQNKEET